MSKKVSIIGAGIAGLCAGCYLKMNDYEVEIYEFHDIPGGLCTTWDRKGYNIDGCIHWLVGSAPAHELYNLWNEVCDMKQIEFYDDDIYLRYESIDGRHITFYRDVNRLETELLEKAPEDREKILEFTNSIRKFSDFRMPVSKPRELMSAWENMKVMFSFMPVYNEFKKWSKLSIGEYAEKFRNPLLRKAMRETFVPEMAVGFIIFTFAWMNNKCCGYPIGGSLNFARKIEKTFFDLGGRIRYEKRVSKILTENGKATGVMTDDGKIHDADIVISAADGHSTIYEMLEGKFIDKTIERYYSEYLPFSSYIQVAFGVDRTFENEADSIFLEFEQPLYVDPKTQIDNVHFRIFNFDPTMAPKGKTSIVAVIGTRDYNYWVELRKNDIYKYKDEKNRIADALANVLERRYGNVKEKIEMSDISTPATVIRYTNNWKGSLEGWILTPDIGLEQMKKTLPGLENFYMVGQWVEPGGGLPAGLMSGRNIAQIICHKDGVEFRAKQF